ncbi:MAG: type IV secretory system conjugative DNA transfer family protein [Odoribacter sp.]|nr:type IV secretory system conjugative DNA transfer family protein [Odoribacter sp.]
MIINNKNDVNIMSESRWARKDEIINSSVKIDLRERHYDTAGLPVFAENNAIYVDGEDRHSIIFGSTGSKKTRLFAMPMVNTMIRAGESFVVTDPKGEIYTCTSGMAKENDYDIVVLNYRDISNGDCWNPLEIPYELYRSGNKDDAMSLINDFIAALSEPHRKTANDIFWEEMAASLALANLLLLMECGEKEEVNLASFASMCSNDSVEVLKKVARWTDENSIAGMNYRNVFSSAEKTMQSVQVSLYAWVRIFVTQKKLSAMLSKNTFDIRNFGRKKTAVYIIVPDEKTTYHFLVTTFIKQVYETLISEAQKEKNGKLPVRVNFVLDEFCNIPAIPDMPSMISAARSRNMRYFLFVQGMHQLNSKYGEDAETIKGNCENWVFLTSKELLLLNEISELCGTVALGNKEKRRLISVSELQRLSKERGEVLILYGRQYPFITELPDISEYEMFQGYRPVNFPANRDVKCKVISVNKLHRKVCKNSVRLFKDETDFDDLKQSDDEKKSTDNYERNEKGEIYSQKDIELKFDEIFGKKDEDE